LDPRTPYEAPELQVLGALEELTNGGSAGDPDGEGSLVPDSDVSLKEAFEPADADEVLAGVEKLDVSRWSYKRDGPGVRHIGPMAQDFAAAFEVGADNKKIHAIDMNGVALAAIKALKTTVDRQERELAELREQLERRSES
jgi:hypothetical protein